MGSRRLLLIRHPAAPGAAGLCYGRTELPAGDGDGALAAAIARLGPVPATVWTSPAVRCCAVADAIAAAIGTVARADKRLHELDFGEWEGRMWAELPRAEVDRWIADPMNRAPPGGETGVRLAARVRAFLSDLPAGTHMVVAHGGPLKVLRSLVEQRPVDPWAPAQACGSVIEPASPPAG